MPHAEVGVLMKCYHGNLRCIPRIKSAVGGRLWPWHVQFKIVHLYISAACWSNCDLSQLAHGEFKTGPAGAAPKHALLQAIDVRPQIGQREKEFCIRLVEGQRLVRDC